MASTLHDQALEYLCAANEAAALGHLDRALACLNSGLLLVPTSTGLWLNRSIIHERLDMDAAAFEDLEQLFKLPPTLERAQQAIALKRFIALGLKLDRTRMVLACLQQLELVESWQSDQFYEVLINHLVLEPQALEASLPHYLFRAMSSGLLTQACLRIAIEAWELHQRVHPALQPVQREVTGSDLLAQLAMHQQAPQGVLHVWLDVLAREATSEAKLLEQATNVLSLWVHVHPLDVAATEQLIQYLNNKNQIDLVEGLFLHLSQRFPKEPNYLLGLARTRFYKRDFKRAFVVINAALELDEKNLEIRLERARLFEEMLIPQLALADLKKNLQLDPMHLPTLIAQVNVLTDLGRVDEALALEAQLLSRKMNDEHRLSLQLAKSFIYRLSGQLPEWYGHIEQLSQQYPDDDSVRCELGWKEVHQGNWAKGFGLLEHRFSPGIHYFPVQPHLEHAKIPRWSPETFLTSVQHKHLLLCGEEGLGDVIQFSRFIPLLQSKGLRISLMCPEALHPLFAFNYPELKLISSGTLLTTLQERAVALYDFYGEIMSIPWVLNLDVKELSGAPYLKALPEKIAQMALFKQTASGRQKSQFAIGLRWVSSLARSSRSVPLDTLRALGEQPFSVFGLHHGPLKETDRTLYEQWSNFYPTELVLEDLAGLMMNLDCVVTSDTVTAHLAGALGRPTFLLKSTFIDWRWGYTGTESAWYQSMSIIRQQSLLDWTEPVAQLTEQLCERMAIHCHLTKQDVLARFVAGTRHC
jgi:tetratricopeptide (TPR) repeat protein